MPKLESTLGGSGWEPRITGDWPLKVRDLTTESAVMDADFTAGMGHNPDV
jgi:hypothetical protein